MSHENLQIYSWWVKSADFPKTCGWHLTWCSLVKDFARDPWGLHSLQVVSVRIEWSCEIGVGILLLPSATLSGFLRIHSVPSSQEFHFLLKSLTTQTFTVSHEDLM